MLNIAGGCTEGDCPEGEAARALPKSTPPESETMSPRKPQKTGDRSRSKTRFKSPLREKLLEKANGMLWSLFGYQILVFPGPAHFIGKGPGAGNVLPLFPVSGISIVEIGIGWSGV